LDDHEKHNDYSISTDSVRALLDLDLSCVKKRIQELEEDDKLRSCEKCGTDWCTLEEIYITKEVVFRILEEELG